MHAQSVHCTVYIVLHNSANYYFFSDRFGSQRTADKIVLLNSTSSSNYTLRMDQPVEVSGVEIIGVDIVCEATVTWSISTQRGESVVTLVLLLVLSTFTLPLFSIAGRQQPTDTALVNIDNTLNAVSAACDRSTACNTLVQFPPERGPQAQPLPVAAIALGIIIPSLGLSLLLAVMVGLVYRKHKKGKLHVSTG